MNLIRPVQHALFEPGGRAGFRCANSADSAKSSQLGPANQVNTDITINSASTVATRSFSTKVGIIGILSSLDEWKAIHKSNALAG